MMDTIHEGMEETPVYPVGIALPAATEERNRLTVAFRFFLALPHVLLVGGPVMAISCGGWNDDGWALGWTSGTGVLGLVAGVVALISWFAIVFTREHPDGLWKLAAYYLRWRVRAVAYLTLLRDEYPPFGDGAYPAELVLTRPEEPRDRVTVLLRFLLAIPHLIVLWFLGLAWGLTTAVAWVMILLTGRYPESLYGFALGVFAWDIRVEAYMLLLRDEYPPFTLRA
jgi:hypothetical protein